MFKNKKLLLAIGIAVLVLCLGIVLAIFALPKDNADPAGNAATYTIEVKSSSQVPLEKVGMYIYEDSTLKELVSYLTTDEKGMTSFTATARDTYVAVLDKVPTGYKFEEYYPITGEHTQIVLETGSMEDIDVDTLTYKLGDAMMDFSVTGPDGKTYTLSELFKGKKAVVLNFFYNECQPCMQEFPFLQEAYLEYSDDIAVIAMNPVNTDNAAIAALQKELGVTFPMVACGAEWEKIMQLTAYPTSVFIDRFGNICLIHKGSVTDAKIFKDAFAYFAAEDYEQKIIDDIMDLEREAPEGSKENPTEVGGVTSFEVTVEPGKEVYVEVFKVFNMYLQIRSENAYVIYNGETHKPENGTVGLMVSAPDTFTPATIVFGNTGKETETFQVTLSLPGGTFNNPYTMSLGDFDVRVNAGNEQGVYYTYTAPEDGTLTLKCLSAPKGVKYGYFLFNTVTSAMRNLESDSVADENGVVTVSVQAKKGQLIQLCFSTLPDENGSYPAANLRFNAAFTAGEVTDTEEEKKLDYTVTVLDDQGRPMPNISVLVTVGKEKTPFTTDATGVVKVSLAPGTYEGEIYIPDGYTAEKTTFQLTETAPNASLTVSKIKNADYTVTILDPRQAPVANVFVKIGNGNWLRTDAQGKLTVNLEIADYPVTIMIPAGFSGETNHAFAEGARELTITLGYGFGNQSNPYPVNAYPYTTEPVNAAAEWWVSLTPTADMVGISISDADAYIRHNETTYGPDADGIVRFSFEGVTAPVVLAIGNSGTARESYRVEATYVLGTRQNPQVITTLGNLAQLKLAAGDADGYYYSYTATKNGEFTARLLQAPAKAYEVTLEAGSTRVLMSQSSVARQATIAVTAGQQLLIHVQTSPDSQGQIPENAYRLRTSFLEITEPEPSEPTGPSEPETTDPETTVPETTAPETTAPGETESPVPTYTYTVNVTDVFGGGIADVGVIILKNGAPMDMITTDRNGVATYGSLELADYTVELFFTGKTYYYDATANSLPAATRSLTVKLYNNIDEADFQEIYILNGNPAYTLYTGGTRVQLGTGKPNFSAEYENNCFYVFTPQEAGTYQITTNTTAPLSIWGSTNFINKQVDYVENNVITFSISGSSVRNTTYVIGVQVDGTVTDAVLNVARIGEPEFSIADQPWTPWESGSTLPATWMNDVGMIPAAGNAYYTLPGNAVFVDINAADGTYNLYYDEAKGYYRLYENGPIVLVNLNAANRFVSLYERVRGNGQYGGSSVTRYFFSETGAFLRKENYTEYLQARFADVNLDANSEPGYYPLTKDMMYVLQNGFADWWNPESPNYLEGFANANPNYAWMFACCYIPQ